MASKLSFHSFKKWCVKEKLLLITIFAVVVGLGLGFLMRLADFSRLQLYYWSFPGDVIMMHMLKAIIVPLIIFSIITGVASLAGNAGNLSLYAITYYMTTTILAIILGIVVSVIIKPGSNVNQDDISKTNFSQDSTKSVVDGLLDIVRNCFPANLIKSTFDQAFSQRIIPMDSETGEEFPEKTYVKVSMSGTYNPVTNPNPRSESPNVLGLIVFCSMFGYFLGKLASHPKGSKNYNPQAKIALDLFNGLNDTIMSVVDVIMWYVPIGLLFLISAKIMGMGDDMSSTWAALGMFILTSLLALFIHGFIVIPVIYFLLVRKNPFAYMAGVAQAMTTAFANASSAATMPITLRNLEVNNKIDTRVTRFMLPLGATINMDGTALYEAIAALFIAQLEGVPLSFGQIITVAVTATAASIGAAAVPSAGLITLIIVLNAVNLPTDNIALILTVDWFLDRFRTMINVWGDSAGCGIVAHLAREQLKEGKEQEQEDSSNKVNIAFCEEDESVHDL